jgi:hypothetical protein
MGMEMFGFANRNLELLWIDPYDYQTELRRATEILALSGLRTSIYNHQLCVLDPELWPFARKSISDWKNIYLDECERCVKREQCGGLFQAAAKRHSVYIKPFSSLTLANEAAKKLLSYPRSRLENSEPPA